eukprot:gene5499-5492_t
MSEGPASTAANGTAAAVCSGGLPEGGTRVLGTVSGCPDLGACRARCAGDAACTAYTWYGAGTTARGCTGLCLGRMDGRWDPRPADQNVTSGNRTAGQLNWPQQDQDWLLGAFFWGYVFTQIPGGVLASRPSALQPAGPPGRLGGKWVLGLGMLLATGLTMAAPLVATWSQTGFFWLRVGVGVGEGVTFPAMHSLFGRWAPPLERSQMPMFVYAGNYVGTVAALNTAGVPLPGLPRLSAQPRGFFVLPTSLEGAISFVWVVLWFLLAAEAPAACRYISPEELSYITQAIEGETCADPALVLPRRGLPKAAQPELCDSLQCGSITEISDAEDEDHGKAAGLVSEQQGLLVRRARAGGVRPLDPVALGQPNCDPRHPVQGPPVPLGSILTSVPVWTVVLVDFCKAWGYYTCLTCLPQVRPLLWLFLSALSALPHSMTAMQYMKHVLGFDIKSNGALSSLPYIAMFFTQ